MLRATYDGTYRSTSGNNTVATQKFRYIVTGTKEELEHYATAKGEYHRENEAKQPLFFSQTFLGNSIELRFTQDGERVFPNTENLEKAKSLINANAGPLGQAMANIVAQEMLQGVFTRSTVPVTPVPVNAGDPDLNK